MMKNRNPLIILALSILSFEFVFGQGSIQSIVPNEGIQGQTHQIVIKGVNTQFNAGSISVDLGSGILISNIDVRNSLTLYITAQIDPMAFPGQRDLTVMSNGISLELFNAFNVIDKDASQVYAILEINPVQVLYASDFDPDNLANSPLVFQVSVMNDQQVRSLKTYFYLTLEGTGLILTAIKEHGEVQPSTTMVFNNREFDEFEMNEEQSSIMSQIFTTGMLPPGIYTYAIEVKQGDKVLTRVEAENSLLNQAGDLVIISPGTPIADGPAPDQLIAQPLFQWISSANQFDIHIYEVEDGQTNVQAITQQQPVYREFGIVGNTYLYPLAAEPLEEGKTYAWQLRSYFNNPNGDGYFDSPLWWFTYDPNGGFDVQIGSIEIVPEYKGVYAGSTYNFKVLVTDINGNLLSVTPSWTVLPDTSMGSVDSNGHFKAGLKPKVGAVRVDYRGYSTYSIVEIKYNGFEFNLLEKLFKNASEY